MSPHRETTPPPIWVVEVLGRTLEFESRVGLPGWRRPSPLHRLLVEAMEVAPQERVLELACGDGFCGLVAALLASQGQVVLADDDALAIACAQANIARNRIPNAQGHLTAAYGDLPAGRYDVVLLVAPAHRGNAVVLELLRVAGRTLRLGGRLYLAGSKREGLATFRRWAEETLGGTATVLARQSGRQVLLLRKERSTLPAEASLPAVQTFSATLRGHTLHFRSRPGLFAHGKVDPASRLLLEVAAVRPNDRVLDLGCGYGLLGLFAARMAPQGEVVLVDRSLPAVECARENIALNAIPNAEVRLGDGVEPLRGERFDLILCNPPCHAGRPADRAAGEHLIAQGMTVLRRGGRFYVVCNEFLPYERTLGQSLRVEEVSRRDGFKVLLGR